MPSFFEGLKRMAQGKPVFNDSDHADMDEGNKWEEDKPPRQEVQSVQPVAAGPKIIPQVTIQRVDCRLNGDNMDCDFFIRNDSPVPVELDKIRLLKTMDEIDDNLNPGDTQEFRVYSGRRPTDTYTDDIELVYKDPSGDYFAAMHLIEFEKQPDNTYIIRRVRFVPPVRDV